MNLTDRNEEFTEVFMAVIGVTPQVLTECLFYYYSDYYKKGRYFDSIKVFTTTEGRDKLIQSLFKEEKLKDLEKALDLESGKIPFNEDSIMLFKGADGAPLDDMRTTEDNEESFSLLYNEIKQATSDPDARVTATVAGGRKTMSTQMALAFQLYGRKHDELIHIMAPDSKMDPGSGWFFPEIPESNDEHLEVSFVPVLRVGRYLMRSLDLSPKDLFKKLQDELVLYGAIEKLVIKKNNFTGDNETFKLPAKPASYLRYLLRRRLSSGCDIHCSGCEECCASKEELTDAANDEILKEHEIISGKWGGYYHRTKEKEQDILAVNETISRIGKEIRESNISLSFKDNIKVRSFEFNPTNRKDKWHGVTIDKRTVKFED